MKSKKQLAILVGSLVMVVVLLATLLPLVVFADVPQRINYQGYLTDSVGNPVDGSVTIVFSIYDAATGGNQLWTETQTVIVKKGLFNVQLGSVNSLPSFSGSSRYLGTKVGADPEMTPRQLVASAPYALNADTVDGLHSTAFVLKSGDTMSASSNNPVLTVTNTGNGTGVYGSAAGSSGYGVEGIGGSSGYGVRGAGGYRGGIFTTPGNGYGVSGYAGGSNGTGVEGISAGNGTGVSGAAGGSNGTGVLGSAVGSNGYGVQGIAGGSTGRGVYGYASNTGDVENYGGYFQADGGKGIAVYGDASNASNLSSNWGGVFWSAGGQGGGVMGYASNNGAVGNIGGYFRADGQQGVGAYAEAPGSSGKGVYGYAGGSKGIGVYGEAAGSEAYAGYFSGNVHVTGNITKEYTTGTSNLATPIAYAYVGSDATIASGTPNVVSVWWNAANSRYEITIAGENYDSRYITIATASPPTNVARFACVGSVSGKLLVSIYDAAGNPTQSQFQFVTYRP